MDGIIEAASVWLARAYAIYGFALVLCTLSFLHAALLVVIVWGEVARARGYKTWRLVPAGIQRGVRLGLEVAFGFINPLIYLAIFTHSMPLLGPELGWVGRVLAVSAWTVVLAFWTLRLLGGFLKLDTPAVRVGVRALLLAALACLVAFTIKDARFLDVTGDDGPPLWFAAAVGPLYLIPGVFLWAHLRTLSARAEASGGEGFFLLPDRAARVALTAVAAVALVSVALALHRRSDANVRELVREHRAPILAAAARSDVDPRLMAAIVYVTHRDQLSPFRGALERAAITIWTRGTWPEIGANETLLNRPLDISVGLAQIKPRTAMAASLLAAGQTVAGLGLPAGQPYWDLEPTGDGWTLPVGVRSGGALPFPVPTQRVVVARALLDASSNLATCALILALYQQQWEAANPAWSLRQRPEILATLYQIGFARSKPHSAPRANAFGDRVRQVYDEPWLRELFNDTGHMGTEAHGA